MFDKLRVILKTPGLVHLARASEFLDARISQNSLNNLFLANPRRHHSTILLLVCKRDIRMLYHCLRTFSLHASSVPKLILQADGSLDSQDLYCLLKGWPNDVTVWSPQDTISALTESAPQLSIFASSHVFGLKLAAFYRSSANPPVLYFDADILWFQDPIQLFTTHSSLPLYCSADLFNDSLDFEFLKTLPDEFFSLAEYPPVCAGLMLANSPLPQEFDLLSVIERANHFGVTRFTEQTIVNLMNAQIGGVISKEIVRMHSPETITLAQHPSSTVAVHYPSNSKEQFWLDYRRA